MPPLQPEHGFIVKIRQLNEILEVRHSAMLLGNAGVGKSCVWKMLHACLNYGHIKPRALYDVINPKAVTADELYGQLTLTREWQDGILSIIMRNMSKKLPPYGTGQSAHWVVLDGDVDPEWIEVR